MDGFLIGLIAFFGGVLIDRIIIVCRRGNARNNGDNGNDRNASDNHNEETRENVENVVSETKQNNNETEVEKNKHNKFYGEMDKKLKILHQKADEALKSEVLISNEANNPELD